MTRTSRGLPGSQTDFEAMLDVATWPWSWAQSMEPSGSREIPTRSAFLGIPMPRERA